MQSSPSSDGIAYVPQQARAGCLLLLPFFPTSVAEFVAAPETNKQIFQKLKSTVDFVKHISSEIFRCRLDYGNYASRAKRTGHTRRSCGRNPLQAQSCACIWHIGATTSALRGSLTLHLLDERGDTVSCTHGNSSCHAMGPYNSCRKCLCISQFLKVEASATVYFEQDSCIGWITSLKDIKAEHLGYGHKSFDLELSVLPWHVAPWSPTAVVIGISLIPPHLALWGNHLVGKLGAFHGVA